MFKKYNKIRRLGLEEVEGILDGHCYVQEKIDGANVSIWLDKGELKMGSRSQEIKEGFNGFCDYVKEHKGIKKLLIANSDYRLYAEWLVKHSVAYKETSYRKMYLFDIMIDDKYLSIDEVYALAIKYNIETPKLFDYIKFPNLEQLDTFVGQSELGEQGEGIVIKNHDFINKFGDCIYAKIVTNKFRELNAITFRGNDKHADNYWEIYVINKYITLARVQKIMNKLQPIIDERLDLKHIPRIVSTVYNDYLTEEIWNIQKKIPRLDFRKLKKLSLQKTKQIYIDILNDNISIADEYSK